MGSGVLSLTSLSCIFLIGEMTTSEVATHGREAPAAPTPGPQLATPERRGAAAAAASGSLPAAGPVCLPLLPPLRPLYCLRGSETARTFCDFLNVRDSLCLFFVERALSLGRLGSSLTVTISCLSSGKPPACEASVPGCVAGPLPRLSRLAVGA